MIVMVSRVSWRSSPRTPEGTSVNTRHIANKFRMLIRITNRHLSLPSHKMARVHLHSAEAHGRHHRWHLRSLKLLTHVLDQIYQMSLIFRLGNPLIFVSLKPNKTRNLVSSTTIVWNDLVNISERLINAFNHGIVFVATIFIDLFLLSLTTRRRTKIKT